MVTPREIGRTLARNTVWNYLGFAANLLSNLVLFPYVVSRVGEAAAGVWLLLGSLTGYMGLMELGLVPALVQFVAAARGRQAWEEIDQAASTTLAVLMAMAVLPLCLAANADSLVGLLQVPAGLEREATLVVAIAVTGFALKMPQAVLQALLIGSQRQDRSNQLWITIALAKLLGAFVVLGGGGGVVGLVTLEACVHLAAGVLQYRWVREELPALSFSRRFVNWRMASHLVSFGGTTVFFGLSTLIIEQTDRLVVGTFLPIAEVTRYAAGWKIYALAYAVPTILLQALGPVAADLFGRGDSEGLRRLFIRMTRYSVAVTLPLGAMLGTSAPWLLNLWMGPDFVRAAVVVQIMVAAFLVTAHNHAGYSIMMARRRAGLMLWYWSAPQAVLNLALSLALVRPLGIAGVALGTMLPALLMEPVFFPRLLRAIGVDWHTFAAGVVRPTWTAAAVSFWPLALVAWRLDPLSVATPLASAACCVVYVFCFWSWGLTGDERRDLLTHVPVFGPRLVRLAGGA